MPIPTRPSRLAPLWVASAMLLGACASAAPAVAQNPPPMPSPTPAMGGVQGQAPAPPPARIVTTATDEVEVAPDRATVVFTVSTRARTAAAAGAENARIQTAVLDTLRRLGISGGQLRTQGLSIHPEYQYPREGGRPTVVGYQASNSVVAEVRDLERLGGLIDAGLAKGASMVGGVQFWASSTETATREALRRAVARARADAEAIAEAAGGRLGPVLEIVNAPEGRGPLPMMAETTMAMRAVGGDAQVETPVERGTIRVRVSIEARFALLPR
jgi:uncharacterized protein